MPAHRQIALRLAEELRCVEQVSRYSEERPHFSTGIPPLDALLPGGGLRRGMLLEWLPDDDEGSGATLMGLLTAAGMRSGECGMQNREREPASSSFRTPIVVVDRHGTFYPPAVAAWGIPLASMILLRPANARDEAWALDQAIRSPAVAAVLAWPSRLDGRAFRRLQLAAESSGAIGILIRPASARREPTWADVRLCVGPANRTYSWRLCIERLHARGCAHGHAAVHVEITPTGQIHEIAPEEQSLSRTHTHKSAI